MASQSQKSGVDAADAGAVYVDLSVGTRRTRLKNKKHVKYIISQQMS